MPSHLLYGLVEMGHEEDEQMLTLRLFDGSESQKANVTNH
jgi:hypothetical protein